MRGIASKLGGSYTTDKFQNIIGILSTGTDVTDGALAHLEGLTHLQTLYLRGTRVTDAGLKEMKNLKALTWLDLGDTRVTDAGLSELKDLKALAELNLAGTKVTEEGTIITTSLRSSRARSPTHRSRRSLETPPA